ncbi:MAG TPA: hypothetical protein P5114_06525 [Hyphomicrobiaceae bacterium]|nr:hypothetical protein [Hyphomicrobiaceae bacterium]
MSRELEAREVPEFQKLYGTGQKCEKCSSSAVSIRIWEAYDSPAKVAGGGIGPDNIVAALVVCDTCGHGEVVSRQQIMKSGVAA